MRPFKWVKVNHFLSRQSGIAWVLGIGVFILLMTLGIRRGPVTWDESYYLLVRNTWRALLDGGVIWILEGKQAAYAAVEQAVSGLFYLNISAKPTWFFLLLLTSFLGKGWATMVIVPATASALWVSHLVRRSTSSFVEALVVMGLVVASPIFLFINAGGFANPLAGAWLYMAAILLLDDKPQTSRRHYLAGMALALAVTSHYTASIPGLCLSLWVLIQAWQKKTIISLWRVVAAAASVFVAAEVVTYALRRVILRLRPDILFSDYVRSFIEQFDSIHDATTFLFPWDYYIQVLTTLEGWLWCALVVMGALGILWIKNLSSLGKASSLTILVSFVAFSQIDVKGTRVISLVLPLIYLALSEGYRYWKVQGGQNHKRLWNGLVVAMVAVILLERAAPLADILTIKELFPRLLHAIESREGVQIGKIYAGLVWPVYVVNGYPSAGSIPLFTDVLTPSSSVTSTLLIVETPRFYDGFDRMKRLCAAYQAPVHSFPWSAIAAYQWNWDNEFSRNKESAAYCVLPRT